MSDPIDPSKSSPPAARVARRSPWRCFLWRVAQTSRREGASAEDLADQLATPRLALWQRRDPKRPLTPLVSNPPSTPQDVRTPRPASKERS